MSSVNIAAGLWGGSKTVAITGHTRHRHTPSPVVPGFKAPGLPPDLSFGPTALAAAIARTATLRNAPVELLSRWRDSALLEVELMIGNGATFSLSSHFGFLADVERTVFAARVGAGITDIAMNSLGYTWRDNADCLSVSLDPRADFIYAGGNASGYGVVLAEAHGSFSPSISNASIGGRATRKYLRQVKPYIAVNSLHPGATRSTGLNKHVNLPLKIALSAAQWFMKSAPRGAATQALLAANPGVSGITGEFWSNCQIAQGNPWLEDVDLAKRLWDASDDIIVRHRASPPKALQQAA